MNGRTKKNAELRRKAGNMSGLGECVLNDGIKIGNSNCN
jgi:hypothetical protein